MPKLIITADDFGLTETINQKTCELHQRGYVSATNGAVVVCATALD